MQAGSASALAGLPLIAMAGVSCRYDGGEPVLAGFDLAVRPCELVAVLGPSGCGKTTALRVLAGFQGIEAGEVRLDGVLVSSPDVCVPPERRKVGIVFQDYALFPHLTVAENVGFGLRGDRRARAHKVTAALEMVGLAGYRDRYPHELSGGQQQRVGLARSLAPGPLAILLDEPFSNLDRQLRATLRREVRDIVRQTGATTVLVTHDREEALSIADRVAVMENGGVVQFDAPEVVYSSPVSASVARMVGPSDIVAGRIAGPFADTEAGRFRYRSPGGPLQNGTRVEVVLRAHDLELGPSEEGPDTRVEYREYQGEFTQYGVRLPSGSLIRVRRRSIARIEIGAKVLVTAPFDRPVLAYRV